MNKTNTFYSLQMNKKYRNIFICNERINNLTNLLRASEAMI